MLNQQALEGNWNQIKSKVREKWGQLTDDDLEMLKGKGDQLVGAIQHRTGEARDMIERFLTQAVEAGASATSRAAETARGYSAEAADELGRASDYVGDSLRKGYEQAESMVQRRPTESVAVAFGLGVVVGAIVGLVLRNR
jgi:uncharacterized protein YjbJ (UPF0337 family)